MALLHKLLSRMGSRGNSDALAIIGRVFRVLRNNLSRNKCLSHLRNNAFLKTKK